MKIQPFGLLIVTALWTGLILSGSRTGQAQNPKTISLIACLEVSEATGFILTHAESSEGSSPPGGTAAAPGMYRVAPAINLKLQEFLGHRVQVSGRIMKEEPRTGKPTHPGSSSEGKSRVDEERNAPLFVPETIKSLSESCPG
jgi:hypothetical protein